MTNHNGSTTLERFIPLSKAARQLALSQSTLHALIDSGKIRAAVLPSGDVGVSERSVQVAAINERLKAIKKDNFKHLCGHPISIAEAAKKYDVPDMTLRSWTQRGLVSVLESGYGKKLDESSVAYCAAIYMIRKETGSLSGAPLLDDSGEPYELKNLWLAEYRRKRRIGPPDKKS